MNQNEPLFYRVDEAARMLSISRSEAYALVYKGVIPHLRINGSMIRIPAAALNAMVEQARHGAQTEGARENDGERRRIDGPSERSPL